MKSVLIETMCLPPIPVIRTIVRHSGLILEAHEHYQKRSFRNRIYLSGAQGITLFSIPLVKGKNEQLIIRDVQIARNDPWEQVLLKKIRANYGSAPFFEFYFDELESIIVQRHKFLWDFNLALYRLIWKLLDIDISIDFTKDYKKKYSDHITDLRQKHLPDSKYFDRVTDLQYQQVFDSTNGHLSNVSILDMILCCGPEALLLLIAEA